MEMKALLQLKCMYSSLMLSSSATEGEQWPFCRHRFLHRDFFAIIFFVVGIATVYKGKAATTVTFAVRSLWHLCQRVCLLWSLFSCQLLPSEWHNKTSWSKTCKALKLLVIIRAS